MSARFAQDDLTPEADRSPALVERRPQIQFRADFLMRIPIDAIGQAGATVALLNSGVDFVMADLFTVTLNGGQVLRWSGASAPIVFNGETWILGPAIDRGKISTKIGVEVATLDITLSARSSDQINGAPLIAFVRANGLDGATLKLERALQAVVVVAGDRVR